MLNCEMTSPSARQVLAEALARWTQPPTALFVSSDAMVQGVLAALSEAGIGVPGRMSLVAFNDTPLSQNATPPLTSIRVLQHELAAAALTSMQACRSGARYPIKTVVPCVYVDRGSVCPPKD